jgi:hypothetical protein
MRAVSRPLVPLVLLALAATTSVAQPKLTADDLPRFQVRARVASISGKAPDAKAKYAVNLGVKAKGASATGSEWSEWIEFGKEQVEATLKGYPAMYSKRYPVVCGLGVGGVADPTAVEVELKFDGQTTATVMKAELYGPRFGFLVWRDADGKPQADTMAGYNRRYWKHLEGVSVPAELRPKLFPVVDRFIGGSDDRTEWKEGIEQLNRAGFSAIMLPPDRRLRSLLLETGQTRTAWAVYSPPGYAFDHGLKDPAAELEKWALAQAKPYRDAGYDAKDMSLYALSDEPGWYYPKALDALEKNPAALARFRQYLRDQNMKPGDFGAKEWSEVKPAGRSRATDVGGQHLFYWTMRFFAWDSARHFANATKALEKEFYPGVPVYTNWNFFAGRLYVPGPVANNADKTSPDAAMGGHDWLEFGRMRGSTMLWTEDWFGDAKAYQWSFYCAKLRSAAEKGGVQFGGYVIPRTAGDRADGIAQKIMTIAGSGGKGIKYFVFGPEYNFPGNCYSERAALLPKMAEAHKMIGAAERVLWPGKRPKPQVAILMPKSAQIWDAKDQKVAKGVSDATNHNLNGATVDYMAEVFNLYLALQHANVPADFVEEEDLSKDGLKAYKVVYVTAPNVPHENQLGLLEWAKAGGHVVTVAGAMRADRYDRPCDAFWKDLGIKESEHPRQLIASAAALKTAGAVDDSNMISVPAFGARTELTPKKDVIQLAHWQGGGAAVVYANVGAGRVFHFGFTPGLSYWRSQTGTKDQLPVGFSEPLRNLICASATGAYPAPRMRAVVTLPVTVDVPLVETPLLLSEKGAAVTVLNWTGDPVESLECAARVPFKAARVTSVTKGKLTFAQEKDAVKFALPLGAVDVVIIEP